MFLATTEKGHWRVIARRTDGAVALLRKKKTVLSVCLCREDLKVDGQTQSYHKSLPPHSLSLAWLSETAADGSASGVQSGQAAGRLPGTPEVEGGHMLKNKIPCSEVTNHLSVSPRLPCGAGTQSALEGRTPGYAYP